MERTITILGTIDNCKKAESLISAKLRASYESDMAQFIPGSVRYQKYNRHYHETLNDDWLLHVAAILFVCFVNVEVVIILVVVIDVSCKRSSLMSR